MRYNLIVEDLRQRAHLETLFTPPQSFAQFFEDVEGLSKFASWSFPVKVELAHVTVCHGGGNGGIFSGVS